MMRNFYLRGGRGRAIEPSVLIKDVQSRLGNEALCLDADLVCGAEHIGSAVYHAERAFNYGTNSSESFAMEVLLYTSGERQLSKAMSKMSVKTGDVNVAILTFDGEVNDDMMRDWHITPDSSVLRFNIAKAQRFGIGPLEVSSVPSEMLQDLVLERVAFVDVIKR